MKHKFKLGVIATLSLVTMFFTGCSLSVDTTPNSANTANTAKPANAASNANSGSNSNANSGSNSAAAPKTEAKGTKIENEKKPEGQKSTKVKENPVPADWVYMYNDKRGYGFSLPAGSTGEGQTVDGTDIHMAETPSGIKVLTFAFKDAKLTKEDLLKTAEATLAELGQTITAGKLTNESDDYSIAEATMTGKDGAKAKAKVLVATDVTDNYVMIVATEESKYAANEKIIDEIWGSFEMWSGGASGN